MKEPNINSSSAVSDFFGNISQIAWLFAQLPQIYQNYRSKSVDGLALPFLLSWLSGDLTNLLGCLLTEQLPFQRNLAIYFTLVDLILIYQFQTYSRPLSLDYQALAHHDPNSISRSLSFSNQTETPEERWRRHLRQVSATQLDSPGGLAREYTRSMSRKGRPRQTSSQSMGGGHTGGAMDASFLSTKSDQTPISNAGLVSSSSVVRSPTYDERGRSLARSNHARLAPLSTTTTRWNPDETDLSISQAGLVTSPPRSPQPSVLPSIAFLGIFTFLVFKTAKIYPNENLDGISRAWDNKILTPDLLKYDSASSKVPILNQILERRSILNLEEPVNLPYDWQRLIGRTSAWLCAILYLTSRLPQIWKNYCRKSVEGLSMTLFIMAFLGNLTYVIINFIHPIDYLEEKEPER